MTCPFAKFASIVPLAGPTAKLTLSYRHPPSSSTVPLTLSDALRVGTAASHRAVERSRGVSLLLNSSPSSSLHAQDVSFDRVDYVRFNIMLACVYVVLEARLLAARQAEGVAALFADAGLVRELARSGALLSDIAAHLTVVESHTGAGLAEIAEAARDSLPTTTTTAVPEDTEDPTARTELLALVQDSAPLAAELSLVGTDLTQDHIALLHPAQVRATLAYCSRLTTLHPTLLLAHAYTRFLGDLSGGQHIVRKASKRFPCAEGFAFYAFTAPAAELKARFRSAMERAELGEGGVERLVGEANTAFDLNTGLFEALLPAALRIEVEEKEGGKVEQSVLVGDAWKGDRRATVAGAVVVAVTTALWISHILTAGSAAPLVGVHA